MSSAVKVLLVLLDPQVVAIADLLTKVLIGEPYNVSQLEQCLSWLTAEAGDRVVPRPVCLFWWRSSEQLWNLSSSHRREVGFEACAGVLAVGLA
mgnify:CR=1 FL=1